MGGQSTVPIGTAFHGVSGLRWLRRIHHTLPQPKSKSAFAQCLTCAILLGIRQWRSIPITYSTTMPPNRINGAVSFPNGNESPHNTLA